jgi:ankyrin repeat protein
VDLLLKFGVDINSKNEFGNTPLHKALMLGESRDIINILISNRADLEKLNDFRQAPVFYASSGLLKSLGLTKLVSSVITY